MGDTGCKLSDSRHLSGLNELILRGFELFARLVSFFPQRLDFSNESGEEVGHACGVRRSFGLQQGVGLVQEIGDLFGRSCHASLRADGRASFVVFRCLCFAWGFEEFLFQVCEDTCSFDFFQKAFAQF